MIIYMSYLKNYKKKILIHNYFIRQIYIYVLLKKYRSFVRFNSISEDLNLKSLHLSNLKFK